MLTPLAPFDGDAILPLPDARAHLNLTSDDSYHDTAVIALRDAAIDWVEGYSGKALTQRQFRWDVDSFCSTIHLPRGPVAPTGAAVSYYDRDGVDTALVADQWYLGRDSIIAAHGTVWPYANGLPGGVRITFTAGYDDPSTIPPMLLAAVKLAMTAMFEQRANPDLSGAQWACDRHRSPVL